MKRLSWFFLVGLLGLFMMSIFFQGCKKEQPEAKPEVSTTEITPEMVKTTVEGYIKGAASTDGFFVMFDSLENRERKLSFSYVHEGFNKTETGEYAVCVDFTEEIDGKMDTLDVDFFLKPVEGGMLSVVKKVIHKVNGQPR